MKKMKWAGTSRKPDKGRIVVNDHLTLSGIPDEAHEYQVNGKSALAWILERYQVTRVSVETVRIVRNLPGLDADEADSRELSVAERSAVRG